MQALPLEFLNGWLFGINVNRVKPELREAVFRYRKECYDVLAEAFTDGRLTLDPSYSDLLRSDSRAAQGYKMAQAMIQLARQPWERRGCHFDTPFSEKARQTELPSPKPVPDHINSTALGTVYE